MNYSHLKSKRYMCMANLKVRFVILLGGFSCDSIYTSTIVFQEENLICICQR